uniref:Uncharacterized protein n=1 Tax=Haemonchus contortus TaxID=6289 RepID=A0A7I4Z2Y0_HAECO
MILKFVTTNRQRDRQTDRQTDKHTDTPNQRIKDKVFGVNQSRLRDAPPHSTSTQNRSGVMSAYVAYTMTCGGQPMYKSVLLSSQTSLVPIHRPGGMEGLVGPGGHRSGIRTPDRACDIVRHLPLHHLRSGLYIVSIIDKFGVCLFVCIY